jgi:hypothetical protein
MRTGKGNVRPLRVVLAGAAALIAAQSGLAQTPDAGAADDMATRLAQQIAVFVPCETEGDAVVLVRAERSVLKANRAQTLDALSRLQADPGVCGNLRHLAGRLLVEAQREPLRFDQRLGLAVAQVQGASASPSAVAPALRRAGLPPSSDRLKTSSDH